ncbi:MAG: hypothetical protein WC303_01075 [Candidatus Paceibacterota bacterium]|jgi:predicted RNase H-like HicB family nuclease
MSKNQLKTNKKGFILNVIYKNPDGSWRAFCYPFDISCEAVTKEKAMEKLEKLINLYIEGLKKYNYPEHLIKKELSYEQDKKMLIVVKKELVKELQKRLKKDVFNCDSNNDVEIIKKGLFSSYQPLAFC